MNRRLPPPVTVLVALVILCACASQNIATTRPDAILLLRVRNENPMDARVYVMRESLEYRVGVVTTFHTEYFRVSPHFVRSAQSLRIKVVPVGGGPVFVTEPILTGTIHQIDVRLANPFAHSAIFVR